MLSIISTVGTTVFGRYDNDKLYCTPEIGHEKRVA